MNDHRHISTLSGDSLSVDEFDKVVTFDLSIGLEISVVDQPRADFGVRPGAPDGVPSVTEVIAV